MSTSEPPKLPELLTELSALNQRGLLRKGVGKTEHFTEEDEESATRRSRTNLGKTIVQIKQCIMWCALAALVFVMLLFGWILFKHVEGIVADASRRAETLSFVWNTFLVVGATLFIEHVWYGVRKRRK